MGSNPTQKSLDKRSNLGYDFLQVLDPNSKPLGWIDSNGFPQGSLLSTTPFLGAPTGSCASSQTAINTLTGDFYSCQNGLWILIGPTAGSLVSPVTSPNPLALDVNVNFKGPNPYFDITRYGVRAVSTVPSTMATINSGSASASLAAASTFQNGDGIVIYGAGPAHSMSTPGAPTVTPSISRVMTATGDVVNGLVGATTYNYQIIARDKKGGLTAASSIGSTTTGASSLGSQSVAISAMSRSNATVTVTTSLAHGMTVGSMVYIQLSSGDNSFAGWYAVNGSADNTHFTFMSGLDTRNGASTIWSGVGTAFWFNCNHISWSPVIGAFQYYVYSDRAVPGTFSLIGVSKPVNGSFTDGAFYWDDFGSPMMDGMTATPGYVPAIAPNLATSDHLVTTILSGAGTTTLTLAASAGTSVAAVTALFDNVPTILVAAAASSGGTLYFPIPVSGSFVTNSVLDLTGITFLNILGAGLTLKDTMIIGSANWYGTNLPRGTTATSFQFESLPSISCAAIPAILITNGNGGHYEGFQLTGVGTNNILMMQDGGGGSAGSLYDRITFSLGSNDFVGFGWLGRGKIDGSVVCRMRRIGAFGQQHSLGSTATPIIYINAGDAVIESVFMSGKGILARPNSQPSGKLTINWGYCQGGGMPFLTIAGPTSAGNIGGNIDISHITPDTGSQPILTYLPSTGTFSPSTRINLMDESPASGVSVVSGNALSTIKVFGSFSGQNTGVTSDSNFTDKFVSIFGPLGTIGYALGIPLAPVSAVVGAGGSVPIGTVSYKLAWIDILGRATLTGTSLSAVTTTGNQTVTITPPTPPTGAIGWAPYRNGALANIPGCTFITGFSSFVDTFGFTCGPSAPTSSNAIVTGITDQGLVTPQLQMLNTLFVNLGTPTNGTFVFCSDCVIANPCAGSGAGAFAKRLNGVWVCN